MTASRLLSIVALSLGLAATGAFAAEATAEKAPKAEGTKAERLAALMDAIAEVYASVFGPDPTEYRAERGLLDVFGFAGERQAAKLDERVLLHEILTLYAVLELVGLGVEDWKIKSH